MFKHGDLVTGIDRTFIRSIYKFIDDIDGDLGRYEIFAYKGRTDFRNEPTMYNRLHSDFRMATKLEIKKASTTSHIRLKNFLSLLKIIRY
jgi:hypothetical protein